VNRDGTASQNARDYGRVCVVLPTYNERASLEDTVRRIRQTLPDATVLVVDDASPDGTGQLADSLAAADHGVEVLHRSAKEGLGAAYIAGFTWALHHDFAVVVECDADGSHQPEQLVSLLDALTDQVSLVIGTRWMPGGSVRNWPGYRRLISRLATSYARLMLRSKLRDVTSGFRAFRADALRTIDYTGAAAHGYCFQIELAWRVERAGLRVVEVPIDFVERAEGRSKMTFGIVLEALWLVTWWGVRSLFQPSNANA